jgi:ubiquinone/menaquinone biosynthesis C-methylase UbiE
MEIELEGLSEDVVERTQQAYGRGALLYAAGGLTPGAMKREMELFAGYLPKGARVLDVGCGPGRDLKEMAAMGFQVRGVDNSQELLDMVEKGIVTLKADLRTIPLEAGSFEGIWANASLLHLPKTEMPKALGEMHRLLQAEGHLMISVKEGNGEGWSADKGMEERFFAYYESEELDLLLGEAGFEIKYSERKAGSANWLTRIATTQA